MAVELRRVGRVRRSPVSGEMDVAKGDGGADVAVFHAELELDDGGVVSAGTEKSPAALEIVSVDAEERHVEADGDGGDDAERHAIFAAREKQGGEDQARCGDMKEQAVNPSRGTFHVPPPLSRSLGSVKQ